MTTFFYKKCAYDANHWSMTINKATVICYGRYKDSVYLWSVNPSDKRMRRTIVSLINSEEPDKAFSRDYTFDEHRGLSEMALLAEMTYRQFTKVVQVFKAGNNSHVWNEETKTFQIGTEKEPSINHVHVLMRDDPKRDFLGSPLLGPAPGKNFDMMGKTPEEGNDKKVVWESEQAMQEFALFMRTEISKLDLSKLDIPIQIIIPP